MAEFSINGGRVWFDISIIPTGGPGPGFCPSLDECKRVTGGTGYNLPMQMTPLANADGQRCRELTCMSDGCPDAYLYPKDDTKTHVCPGGTDFQVTFCPGGSGGAAPPAPPALPALPAPPASAAAPAGLISAVAMPGTEASSGLLTNGTSGSAASEASIDATGSLAGSTDGVASSSSGSKSSESADATEAPTDPPAVEVVTQSSGGSGTTVGVVLACVFVFVGAIAATVIFVLRAKQRKLENEPKSPINHQATFL